MPLPELPSPVKVANRCANRAWKEGLTDKDRYLLEAAADTIRLLMRRNVELARLAEHYEADAARLFFMHFGPTKGGGS
jgi:hypothetical protein